MRLRWRCPRRLLVAVQGGATEPFCSGSPPAMYGLVASLIKYTVALARAEGWHLFLEWPVYALLVVGAGGIVLSQAAYQAGPLAGAMPPLIIADPIVAVTVAVWAFGEVLATDAVAVTYEVIGFSAMSLAIVRLADLASGRGSRAGGRP